jgi:hypothetical protein
MYLCIIKVTNHILNLNQMTASQITKRLVKNGIALTFLTIEKNEIEVAVDYTEQNGYGSVNERKTKTLANKIEKLFPEISHSSVRQYGAISFSFNFTKRALVANNID